MNEKEMLTPFVDLTKEQIQELSRLRVIIEEKESRSGKKYYSVSLFVHDSYTVECDYKDFDSIKFELVKIENDFPDYKNAFAYNCPCRFYTGKTKKGYTYYRIQAILSKSVSINFFLSYDLAKLLELKKIDFNWFAIENNHNDNDNDKNSFEYKF